MHAHIDGLLEQWQDKADHCREVSRSLHYQSRDRAYDRLLYAYEDKCDSSGLWPTLNSMRNVESSAALGVV